MKTLKEITYEYAQLRGGGLPLTAEELCNCVVQWVQQYTQDQISATGETLNKIRTATYEAITSQLPIKLTKREANEGDYNLLSMDIWLDVQQLFQELMALLHATDLLNYFEGSDTVVVDLNEAGDKIEIHLDGDVLAKLDRAVLTPTQAPAESEVPVLGVNNTISWEPVSSFVGGGKLYAHKIRFSTDTITVNDYIIITNYPNTLTPSTFYDLMRGATAYYPIIAYTDKFGVVLGFQPVPDGVGAAGRVCFYDKNGGTTLTGRDYIIDSLVSLSVTEL